MTLCKTLGKLWKPHETARKEETFAMMDEQSSFEV